MELPVMCRRRKRRRTRKKPNLCLSLIRFDHLTFPPISLSLQYLQQGEPLPDEAGNGESAGAVSDWGFAYEDADLNDPEPEYSDDEDFESPAPVSAVPPIANGSSSLPAAKAPGGIPPIGNKVKTIPTPQLPSV